jgi:ribonuclease HI
MATPAPHFLLKADCRRQNRIGNWHFVLQTADGRKQADVEDAEPALPAERLELLAVVRGLEAIDSPAKVTLQTSSRYVRRGIKYGLDEWRENNWHWEWHGKMVPVKNEDLWRRLDRALQVHDVQCQLIRIDGAHESKPTTQHQPSNSAADTAAQNRLARSVRQEQESATQPGRNRKPIAAGTRYRNIAALLRLRLARWSAGLFPRPRLQ